tara:strand:+ start:1164 stop:1787 length:624 start_codon:yes stop_codon:yes gene_type:complete
MEFKDTIGIFENAFTKKECKDLIKRHEEAIKEGISWAGSSGEVGKVQSHKKSTDYNIANQDNETDQKLTDLVAGKFNDYIMKYLNEYPHNDTYDHSRIITGKTSYPLLQMQKYDQGSGHYNSWHCEKEMLSTSSRMFVFILYLNDVSEGGETGFLFKEDGKNDFFKVKPEVGKLIIHPASWPYIHKGYMPESDDKYILTTWLCYVGE